MEEPEKFTIIVDGETIEVVILSDPEWSPALDALQKEGDPSAIARLLKRGAPPDWVARVIGIMLDAPPAYRGTKLVPKLAGKRSGESEVAKLVDKRKLRERIMKAKGDGQLEPAIVEIMKETGLARSTLFEALSMDSNELVFQTQKILGNVDERGMKSGENRRARRTRRKESGK